MSDKDKDAAKSIASATGATPKVPNPANPTSQLLNRVRVYKGHLTRQTLVAERAIAFAEATPSSLAVQDLEDAFQRISDLLDKVTQDYLSLMELDPSNSDTYEQRLEQTDQKGIAVKETLMSTIAAATRASAMPVNAPPMPAPAPAPGAPAPRTVRVQTALQPEKLSRDATPQFLRSLARKLRAFHSASNMQLLSIPDQQAYFFQSLDLDLETTVRGDIDDATAIFGDDGCVAVLEKHFLITYPIFTRRLGFFRDTQVQGQSFSDWFARLRQLGDESELPSLGVDDLYVHRMISGCIDTELKKKFLKLQDPTLEEMLHESSVHEATKRSLKATNDGRHKNGNSGKLATVKGDLKNKCYSCGEDRHASGQTCSAKNKTCRQCGKTGHVATSKSGQQVCMSKNASGGNSDANKGKKGGKPSGDSKPSKPKPKPAEAKQADTDTKTVRCSAVKVCQVYSRAKDLRKFEINDRIIIQNPINKHWNLKARVLSQHNPRSYEVQTEDGKIFVRNGRFLRADTALQEEQEVILAENNAELRRSAKIANQQ